MEKWTEDIQMAIDLAEKSNGPTPELLASSPPDNSKWWGCAQGHKDCPHGERWVPRPRGQITLGRAPERVGLLSMPLGSVVKWL